VNALVGKRKIEYHKKICLLGDPAVGKTSLIRRFVLDEFSDDYLATLGTKITEKTIDVYFPRVDKAIQLTLLIWDIAGHKTFSSVHESYYAGAEGALVVCDYTRRETVDNLYQWIYQFRKCASYAPGGEPSIIIITNKSDLAHQRGFELSVVERLARSYGVPHILTSAKLGEGVEHAFRTLAMNMLRKSIDTS
jgi:small GTP-binding protein